MLTSRWDLRIWSPSTNSGSSGQQLRVDSIGPSTSAGSGHPTSSTGPAIAHLAVSEMPGSGTTEELLDAAGLTAGHIVRAAEALLSQAQPTIALE